MGPDAFLVWAGVGSYGGLASSLLAAGGVAVFARVRHRGTPKQLVNAVLLTLVCACLSLLSVWWKQTRLDLYGPSLDSLEVTLWLTWIALCGWSIPIGVFAGYTLLATDQMATAPPISVRSGAISSPLNDPARRVEPLGPGHAWGLLIPTDGPSTGQSIPLTHQLTLLGREIDNDVVINDDRASRHHAEIHWDRGHVELVDRGSMNGTRINHQVVRQRTPLRPGDIIEMGERAFRFELAPAEQRNAGDVPDEETRKVAGIARTEHAPVLEPLILSGQSTQFSDKRWELCDAVVTIGRDESRQVCLPHESVSRLHAQIVRQPAGYFITDMHSRNGTLLNGVQLDTPVVLAPGDVLTLGEVVVLCESVPGSGRGTAASVTVTIQHQPSDAEPGESAHADVPEIVFLQRRSVVDRTESPRLAPQTPAQCEQGGKSDEC